MAATTMAETALITLTQVAADKLTAIMDEQGLRDTYALRVFISGSSCSGLQYGMAFDDSPRDVDVVFEDRGLRVVVDPQSLPYMVGSSIDYLDSPLGSGFHIENPNAVSGCRVCGGGCG